MDWRDLIAWQQARSSLVLGPTSAPPGTGGSVLVVNQDPHRIYLLIVQVNATDMAWISPSPMSAREQGLAVGNPVVSGDPTSEFWLDKHGLLPQLAWYAWCDTDAMTLFTITVTQDQSPCDTMPKWRTNVSQSGGLYRTADIAAGRAGGNVIDPSGISPDRKGGADSQRGSAQQVLGSIWSAGGLKSGNNGVSGQPTTGVGGSGLGGQPLTGYMGNNGNGGGVSGGSGAPPVTAPAAVPAVTPAAPPGQPTGTIVVQTPSGPAAALGVVSLALPVGTAAPAAAPATIPGAIQLPTATAAEMPWWYNTNINFVVQAHGPFVSQAAAEAARETSVVWTSAPYQMSIADATGGGG